MPIDFPSSPTTGQQYTYSGRTWEYNGTGWILLTYGGVITASTSDPSGGNDGDIWIKYTA